MAPMHVMGFREPAWYPCVGCVHIFPSAAYHTTEWELLQHFPCGNLKGTVKVAFFRSLIGEGAPKVALPRARVKARRDAAQQQIAPRRSLRVEWVMD